MEKLIKKLPFVALIAILLFGCSEKSNFEVSSAANYNIKILYPNGMPEGETINVNTAVAHVEDKFKSIDTENISYWFENIEFINDRIYYIFRRFEDRAEHIVTLGYYAVDVFTGEVFDTEILTDLIKIE